MRRTVLINRTGGKTTQKIGDCYVFDENNCVIFQAKSIERGWNNNVRGESCIPIGEYPLAQDWSPKYHAVLWEIFQVPERSECKFHWANYARQLEGCIALGNKHVDIDGDGHKDVTSSRKTIKKFHDAMEGATKAQLVIRDLTQTNYQWKGL